MKKKLSYFAAVIAATSLTEGAITYVDADEANTTTAGAPPFPTGANVYNDDQWSIRTLTTADAVGATIFEAGPENAGGENAPLLTTTITGLNPGEVYEVYAYFVTFASSPNQHWQINAGLQQDALTFFNHNTGGADLDPDMANIVDSADDPITKPTGGGRAWSQAYLGTAAADGSGEIAVYIDAPIGTDNANHRTWYDGVGYQLVPEPSSALLSGLGLLALLRRRR